VNERGRLAPPSSFTSQGVYNGELVRGGGRDLIGPRVRRAVRHRLEQLDHLRVRVLDVGVELILIVPQRDFDGLVAVAEQRELVPEAGGLAEDREDFLLEL
jgi:hypothetical protein